MGLFRNTPDEDKENVREFIEDHGLEELDQNDLELLESTFLRIEPRISTEGSYLRTLVDQNWIIMRQLERLNKNIETLKSK